MVLLGLIIAFVIFIYCLFLFWIYVLFPDLDKSEHEPLDGDIL